MVAVCGCRPLGRSDRREVLNSEYPCPAGMDLGARRGIRRFGHTESYLCLETLAASRHRLMELAICGLARTPTPCCEEFQKVAL